MGKTSNKKADKAKLEAKKARLLSKQVKKSDKRTKKELQQGHEQSIDALIAECNAKEQARVAVSISVCAQPSPRSNFSLTLLPSNEFLMYGGEFCDGEDTAIYNDLYRWNVERNEWRHIESLNTPPPRCSHQAVCYKDKVYIFGGEYATLDNFHHYRDFWELDLKTSVWVELKTSGDVPSARSGHRMVVWRNYLVLFGGFYEAMREVRWYNDAYVYSFQEKRWTLIPQRANAQVPKPRSGVSMFLHSAEDAIYIYGGYSKEKVAGSFKEGRVHEDVWVLQLRPAIGSGGTSSGAPTRGTSQLDLTRAVWQRISRKGDFPSTRCGCSLVLYKNKALLFGGVFDEEGPRHTLSSTFFNDLFAFDMERKRWYKLGLKQKKAKLSSSDRRLARSERKRSGLNADAESDGDDADGGSSDDGGDGDDEELEDGDGDVDTKETASSLKKMAKDSIAVSNKVERGELFGYIDETGNVVYIDMSDSSAEDSAEDNAMLVDDDDVVLTESCVMQSVEGAEEFSAVGEAAVDIRIEETRRNQLKYSRRAAAQAPAAADASVSAVMTDEMVEQTVDAAEAAVAGLSMGGSGNKLEMISPSELPPGQSSYIHKYFSALSEPCPRINPALIVRGSTLYIYGGVTELGDMTIPLDDCWSLDLNKRDNWKRLLEGTMHRMVWRGDVDMDGSSQGQSNRSCDDDSNSDDDSDSGSEDDDDDDDEDDEDDDDGAMVTSKKPLKGVHRSGKGVLSVRTEMEGLRAHLDTTDSMRTPLSGETLRQFYSRTAEYWAGRVIDNWHASQQQAIASGTVNKNETLSEKEVKKLGFGLAETRYNELLPLLARLNELEQQQQEEEGPVKGRPSGGGSDHHRAAKRQGEKR